MVWFKDTNVVHMGDHFFNRRFPYIDVGSGGSVDGFIANVERVLTMVPDDITIIPGHGALANKQDLRDTIDTIKLTSRRIRKALDQGTDVGEIAVKINQDYESWGSGFINAERWISIVSADGGGR